VDYQQDPQLRNQYQQKGKDREAALLAADGAYNPLAQRLLATVQVLVAAGADLAGPQGATTPPLVAAAMSGLWPVVEYLLPHAMTRVGDETDRPAEQRMLSLAMQGAARCGHLRCLQSLMGAAASPEADVCVAALCRMTARMDVAATQMLLRLAVPVNGHLRQVGPPLHFYLRAPVNQSRVSAEGR
jgi:hypothetical protein